MHMSTFHVPLLPTVPLHVYHYSRCLEEKELPPVLCKWWDDEEHAEYEEASSNSMSCSRYMFISRDIIREETNQVF